MKPDEPLKPDPTEGFAVGEESQGTFERILSRTMGLAMIGMLVLILTVAFTKNQTVLVIEAVVFVGPFFIAALTMLGAFCGSLIIWGEPDRLMGKLFGDDETDA